MAEAGACTASSSPSRTPPWSCSTSGTVPESICAVNLPIRFDRLRHLLPLHKQARQIRAARVQQFGDLLGFFRASEIGQGAFVIRDLYFQARHFVFNGVPPLLHLAELDRVETLVCGRFQSNSRL